MKLGMKFTAGALLSLVAGIAFATPVYNGEVEGSFDGPCGANDSGPYSCPDDNQPTTEGGYWIWTTGNGDWSIRWTAGSETLHDFYGDITVQKNGFDGAATTVKWENNDIFGPGGGSLTESFIQWDAVATYGWDGIDFSIDGVVASIEFNLGSSLWDTGYFDDIANSADTDGQMIYISGAQNTPLVEIMRLGDREIQQFEVSVPEPGTLALLGLGLAGMGFSHRKAAK